MHVTDRSPRAQEFSSGNLTVVLSVAMHPRCVITVTNRILDACSSKLSVIGLVFASPADLRPYPRVIAVVDALGSA
jgi:hypothetical protein